MTSLTVSDSAALAHLQALMLAALESGDESAYLELQAQQERLLVVNRPLTAAQTRSLVSVAWRDAHHALASGRWVDAHHALCRLLGLGGSADAFARVDTYAGLSYPPIPLSAAYASLLDDLIARCSR